jgi:tetratricopeptide (TPR) repeat protein
LGDRDSEARDLTNIGVVERDEGRYPDALRSLDQALALSRVLSDRDNEANSLVIIGEIETKQLRFTDALQSYQRALALYQQVGDEGGEAQVLTDIGDLEEHQGRHADALRSYQQALAAYQQIGDQAHAAQVTRNIEKVRAIMKGATSPPDESSTTPQPSTSPWRVLRQQAPLPGLAWSGRRESNPRLLLGRQGHYHYATPANWAGLDLNQRSAFARQIYSLVPLTTRPPTHVPAL